MILELTVYKALAGREVIYPAVIMSSGIKDDKF